MIPHDYHIHSNFSADCKFPIDAMCEGALANEVKEIGFTEHYDLHPQDTTRNYFRLKAWATALAEAQAKFAGRLLIRAGIELGEPHVHVAEVESICAQFNFDYRLGSLHWVGDDNIFDAHYFKSRTPREAFGLYFEALECLTRWGQFEVLSHLDVVARTGQQIYGTYDPCAYEGLIRPILKNCITQGIALDLNTKSWRTKLKLLTPNVDILRWYVELGGERVTLGSDAHQPNHVGAGCLAARAMAAAAGLKYLTYFEQYQARLVPI
jgi:histidinol-phosphatase (PHP family)